MLRDLKKQLGLSTRARPKPTAVSQDLEVLLGYLWETDQHVYKREFYRVQLALCLLILAYTAARIGAIIVSDAYRDSNQALTYRVSHIFAPFAVLLT